MTNSCVFPCILSVTIERLLDILPHQNFDGATVLVW